MLFLRKAENDKLKSVISIENDAFLLEKPLYSLRNKRNYYFELFFCKSIVY